MIEVSAFLSFNIAILLLLIGKAIKFRSNFLRKYSIPEPVIGGFLCSALVALIYFVSGHKIQFALGSRDFLLLVFFAAIGLRADISDLVKGGKPLLMLLFLATAFMIMQNVLGISLASLFGLDPHAGLMVGSISLTGGVGTTAAWAPIFVDRLGVLNAMELGIASNMGGLFAACVIGGPIATYLIKRHKITASPDEDLNVGVRYDATMKAAHLDYFNVLRAILGINIAIMIGFGIDALVYKTGFTIPTFVSCLVAGILFKNLGVPFLRKYSTTDRIGINHGLSLLSDLSLGIFLTMALMGLQLWALSGVFAFIAVCLILQIVLTVLFTVFVVFKAMGRDYEAAVICAGFGGITLGSTATAIANMTAVSQQYGAAPRAFIIVPVVCGFFIDIVNALVISLFVG
ncbi:sodium/glutamate symporter [Daeguia caeni]|uniref:Sodium/glutamate symporter n=1 Tax=Daeguia caeni TaxID=439612 RepID=A0ABV9H829_9HYPH